MDKQARVLSCTFFLECCTTFLENSLKLGQRFQLWDRTTLHTFPELICTERVGLMWKERDMDN